MEEEVRKIVKDSTLSQSEKNFKIQELYKKQNENARKILQNKAKEEEDAVSECTHYKRSCFIETNCCAKFYGCRRCHDEKEQETHKWERRNTTRMRCNYCNLIQPVHSHCQNEHCKEWNTLNHYYCETCLLWEENEEKKIYHCEGCGICRMGEAINYKHCFGCKLCLTKSIFESHTCLSNVSENYCSICKDTSSDLRTSTISVTTLPCGHLLHHTCFEKLVNNKNLFPPSCPICRKSLLTESMDDLREFLQQQMVLQPMPMQYSNFAAEILCNDCVAKSLVKFHFLGAICPFCDSVNTSRLHTVENCADEQLTVVHGPKRRKKYSQDE